MPRASKLTEAQWASLEKRLLAGETASALGRIGLERVEALEANNAQHKWSHGELIEILATYKAKRKALEAKPAPAAAPVRIPDHLPF